MPSVHATASESCDDNSLATGAGIHACLSTDPSLPNVVIPIGVIVSLSLIYYLATLFRLRGSGDLDADFVGKKWFLSNPHSDNANAWSDKSVREGLFQAYPVDAKARMVAFTDGGAVIQTSFPIHKLTTAGYRLDRVPLGMSRWDKLEKIAGGRRHTVVIE